MKRLIQILFLAALVIASWQIIYAQSDDGSTESLEISGLGIGYRYLPSALAPYSGIFTDPELNSALFARFSINPHIALEIGGFLREFEDDWSKNKGSLITGGILGKLSDQERFDIYVALRGLSFRSTSVGMFHCPFPADGAETADPPESSPVPPCYLDGETYFESNTLAVDLLLGLEWQPSHVLGFDIEFGYRYSQSVTTNRYPDRFPPPPTDGVPPVEPQTIETFSSSALTPIVQLGVIFYF